nr:RHS repeat-associated core domain-containing protein [Hallella multisaccharivorax]
MEGVYINGAPQGITFHETDNFTLYPAPIISINKNRFTKHYFIGSQRIASRIGTGTFNNVYGVNGSYVTAGQQDYAERMNQIQSQKEAYYKQLGVAPGVPTEKGAYGDPENTGVGYNSVLTELGNHDVPQGWVQTPKHNTTEGSTPGTPISWNEPSTPDNPQAGYGYIPNDTTTEETFFFHSDHLGSTSYITDGKGNITQYDAYLPYGELIVDEHSSSEDMPYKFNGKEFDEETGLYYYGARYMDPVKSLWYGADPLAEKYVNISPYLYCHANPIVLMDPTGMADKDGACEIVNKFLANRNTTSVFKNIPKSVFVKDLLKQINDPSSIRQGNNGTCGAAVLCKYMAETDPVLYAQTAIGLYTMGTYTPKGGHMTLSVTEEMEKGTLGDLSSPNRGGGISSVDAIMQGAIINTNNYIESINTFKGESGLNSFMYPGFIKRFVSGFMGRDEGMMNNWPTNNEISEIDFKKNFVIATTYYNVEKGRIESSWKTNHYINITSINKSGLIGYWSWGSSFHHKTSGNHMNGMHQLFILPR